MKKHGLVGALLVLGAGCDVVLGIEQPTSVLPNTECRTWVCDEKPCHYEYAAQFSPCSGGACDGAGECRFEQAAKCTDAAQCASRFCADGYCCDHLCDGKCQRCTPAGECIALPRGARDDDTCALYDVCDGAGNCKRAPGQPCVKDGAEDGKLCASGYCADGVCCDTACADSCKACNLAGLSGTCSNIPEKQTDANATVPCTEATMQMCNGSGVCIGDLGASCSTKDDCRSGHCADGVCCNEDCTNACATCNLVGSKGTCGPVPLGDDDNEPFAKCTDVGFSCDGNGHCAKDNGLPCGGAADCTSGICVDGVCCNSQCNGQCVACNQQNKEGTCTAIPLNLDPQKECDNGACGGDGTCKRNSGQACVTVAECLTNSCQGGVCTGLSCLGLASTCGSQMNVSCCASSKVFGGTYPRSQDSNAMATVDAFLLDTFEVTVGRFRKFVEAYPGSKPVANAGAHPKIQDSGWQAAWTLPAEKADLTTKLKQCGGLSTWTDMAGVRENHPINCVAWEIAFAFCAWDGGRLPTEAEWNRAAAGTSGNYYYPWAPLMSDIAPYNAVYACGFDGTCTIDDILPVGSKPFGSGAWGQMDLGGNVWEWVLDYWDVYAVPCQNCAQLNDPGQGKRVLRGGGWRSKPNNGSSYPVPDLSTATRGSSNFVPFADRGLRCARQP